MSIDLPFWYNVYRQTDSIRKEPMLVDIILYLLQLIQYLYQQNCWLLNFICRYIPLKQWAFDDSHSPKYQKFKIDEIPLIIDVEPWDYRDYMAYLKWRYPDDKPITLSAAVPSAISTTIVFVPTATLPKSICTKTMVPKVRYNARSARIVSLPMRIVVPLLNYVVPIAVTHSSRRRIVNTS